jgi:Icc protein
LYADPHGELLGLKTRHCLDTVIKLVQSTGQPDMVVASGDLSHDGSTQSYQQLRDCFGRIGAPVYCLPGNHDEGAALHRWLNDDIFHHVRSHHAGGWLQVFLDSTVPGSEGGHLADRELDELHQALGAQPDLPALIWLHHQPVNIGSRWLDTMAVDNHEAFFAIVDQHPQVRAIAWGHVHQLYDTRRNGVQLLATPSTCLQFLPGSEDFAVDMIPPGYRWLELFADGSLRTGVERLQQIPGDINLQARGY